MPPPAGLEVFPILKDSFFTSFVILVNTIDPIRNHPHKVLQGLQVVWVGARMALDVSVCGKMVLSGRLLQNRTKVLGE